ncbi:hypothetical protein So717_35960 [Roseobacter cerasinus]|uniref:Flavodoxin n=1 Tax=Roseobacter cerasinus TaxID=2602289 RepID=A0A640VUK2_9RHOB|nr:hypothetical protein [Roseobacter cerasinus]GFE51843.1 hypothetical protein So717_35960 [Roseobacter cerasinus]
MGQASKIAVVYFSMSGHSEKAAKDLAKNLAAELIAIHAPKYRPGLTGYIRAGLDSLRQKCDLAPQTFTTLAGYRCLVLCGPVWTSYPATPLRALLRSKIALPQSVSLFLTSGGHSPAQKAFDTAEADLGRPLTATAVLANTDEDTERGSDITSQFASQLKCRQVAELEPAQ